MCSRHAEPGAGASYADIGCKRCGATYTVYETHDCPRPFRAQLVDIEGPAWWITLSKCWGPKDAMNQAKDYVAQTAGEDVRVVKVVAA